MKLHIVKQGEEAIDGFEKEEIGAFGLSLNSYVDNELEEIFANDLIDLVDSEKVVGTIQSIVSKMRLHGRVVIGGTDLRVFSKMIINGTMKEESASKMINNSKCMLTSKTVMNILRQCGLRIIASYINGVHYEIEAQRG